MLRRTPLKRTGFKKKRKVSLSSLKKKLWKLKSERIRRKYADHAGMVKCVTCELVDHWKRLQCGHFVGAYAGNATYFVEENLHPQCYACNIWRRGNMAKYALFMTKTYGPEKIEELVALSNTIRKISAVEYEELIEEEKAKLAALNGEGNGN